MAVPVAGAGRVSLKSIPVAALPFLLSTFSLNISPKLFP